jgi:NAD(P)-dependent dehydrogenase (short-subunit alcohol dehydrogenase family)
VICTFMETDVSESKYRNIHAIKHAWKVALVTGGSSGVGLATAKGFAREDASGSFTRPDTFGVFRMSKFKPLYALSMILLSSGVLAGCAAERKCGWGGCPGDAQITANVQTQLNRHPDLEGVSSINVQTVDHVVYLSGDVSSGLMRETAEAVAQKTSGVTHVEDSIAVIP